MSYRIRIWDLPTRLFHWLLVISIVAAIVTGKIGGNAIIWHGRIGLFIVGLLAFRIVWGFIGSTYARFASFFPTPAKIGSYLRGQWRGLGHNPLGALSVFGLLAAIALQLVTGLLANDDIAYQAYLSGLIDKSLGDTLTGVHRLAINLLIALIGLHLAAIVFYAHVKKDNLVKPMLTGWKEVEEGTEDSSAQSATGGGMVAFIVAMAIALAAVYGASGAWISTPPPPPTPVQSAPSW